MDYESSTIRVACFGYQKGLKIIQTKVDQNKAIIKDHGTYYTVSFNENDVIPIWVRVNLTHTWRQGIAWRVGTNQAIKMGSLNDDFLPLLTQQETAAFIQRTTAEQKARPKRMLSNLQFAILLLAIGAVAGIGIANLFGVHLSASTGTTIQQVINATVTPRVTPFP